jgi:Fur family ferric uptake transcriptional regulator
VKLRHAGRSPAAHDGRGLVSSQQLREALHRAGLRGTASRLAVLERLRRAASPLSHGEIVEALAPLGFDRATLYRNLIDLTDAGLLRRIDVGDHTWRFEMGRSGAPRAAGERDGQAATHPHFVCTDCGSLACLPDVDVRISQRRGGSERKIADVSQVLLQGRCANC